MASSSHCQAQTHDAGTDAGGRASVVRVCGITYKVYPTTHKSTDDRATAVLHTWSGPGPGLETTTEVVRAGSWTADLRDRNLALAFHGGGDRVHDGEGCVVLYLGEHAVAAIGLVQVRVGAEVDEELRVPTVGHVPMSNRRGASRVRDPRPDCVTRLAWVGEGAGGRAGRAMWTHRWSR